MAGAAGMLMAVGLLTAGTAPAHAISGGEESDRGYSFMASIADAGGDHFCGGTLIDSRWILTARHCVETASGAKDPATLQVRLGTNDRTSGGELHSVKKVVLSPGTTDDASDLALLELTEPSARTPAPLADSDPAVGQSTRALGWGDHDLPDPGEEWPEPPTKLRQLDKPVVSSALCDAPDPVGYIPRGGICVDAADKMTTRAGDSGGPLLERRDDGGWTLVGVTSCAGWLFTPGRDVHSIYAGVASERGWIDAALR